jgi:hypothetical protein
LDLAPLFYMLPGQLIFQINKSFFVIIHLMNWKQLIKPNFIKILVTVAFFGISSYFSYPKYFTGMDMGFPVVFYTTIGFAPFCFPSCDGVNKLGYPIYQIALLGILHFVLIYIIVSLFWRLLGKNFKKL